MENNVNYVTVVFIVRGRNRIEKKNDLNKENRKVKAFYVKRKREISSKKNPNVCADIAQQWKPQHVLYLQIDLYEDCCFLIV